MPVHLTWLEIALRLLLSLFAGAAIGFDRGGHGRPAGLRTTILVCLAAAISMLQANLLLGVVGKEPNSFVVLDLMRLPLGILSGMGFIGAGAIIRRDNRVQGVTTAATLWFVTVMGLCFGGGQIGLGLAALALGLVTVSGLKRVESHMIQERHASLCLVVQRSVSEQEIRAEISSQGFRVSSCAMTSSLEENSQEFCYEVKWRGHPGETSIPSVFQALANRPGVLKVDWQPTAGGVLG